MVVQVKVEVLPGVMVEGEAESVHEGAKGGGGGGGVTATVASQVASPPRPAAVPIKVVVAVRGEVEAKPRATGVEVPMPLLMKKVMAFTVVHESEVPSPSSTVSGTAERVHKGAPGGGSGTIATVASHSTEPPGPTAVPMKVVVAVRGEVEVAPARTGVTNPML